MSFDSIMAGLNLGGHGEHDDYGLSVHGNVPSKHQPAYDEMDPAWQESDHDKAAVAHDNMVEAAPPRSADPLKRQNNGNSRTESFNSGMSLGQKIRQGMGVDPSKYSPEQADYEG